MADLELITRFGAGNTSPMEADLAAALHEVFVEVHPELHEADYIEHPNAWLSYGFPTDAKWTVYKLELSRDRKAVLSKMADQDDAEPEFVKHMVELSEDQALHLWRTLARRDLPSLLAEPWLTIEGDA
jgi:hypothetical protein